jgi:3-hydroxyanthranilate 3,4-dioxygenase
VIERERSEDEMDGLRYYVDGTIKPLWEEWFHCYDLGTQLGPVIKKYLASKEHASGKPPEGKVFPPPPVKIDTTTPSNPPLNLACWMVDNKEEINKRGSKVLYSRGEFKVTVWGGDVVQEGGGGDGETFLWQLKGSAEVTCDRGSGILSGHSCTLIQAGEKFKVHRKPGSMGITVTTDPFANK